MSHLRTLRWRLALALVLGVVTLVPALSARLPDLAYAQDLSADPQSVSPTAADLRPGFQLVPDKSEQREPVPGITVYEADFVRDQTPQNFANGPIEIKSLVAKTGSSQQASEQFDSSRQALTTASPAWVESKTATMGDQATGLSMQGTSSEGPAVAHLFLFRRGAMVVGITVAGLQKPTTMAEAESIAATVLKKIDPSASAQTGPKVAHPLNTTRPPSTTAAGAGSGTSSTTAASTTSNGTGPRFKVANTGGTGVHLRTSPSKTGTIASTLPDGTVVEIVGDDKQGDGLTWKNVKAPGDGTGYIASDYLVAVAGGSSTTTTASASPSSSSSSTPSTSSSSPPSSGGSPSSSSSSKPSKNNNSSSNSSSNSSGSSSNPSSGTSSTTPVSTGSTAPQGGNVLKVDVAAASKTIKPGDDQTVTITVTNGGQPVAGAQVTVKTSPTGETPPASATDASGKTTVTWKPSGNGFIGVGVSVLATDGGAGVGGASFQIQQ